jgi:4-amino-4-deoxy-L-arabinose transferase-like glycosyltransferase
MLPRLKLLLPFVAAGILLSMGNYYDSDEGIILNGAWQLVSGKSLYQDFFSFVAPGSYLWVALAFSVLGPSYTAARTASVLLLLCSAAAVYELAFSLSGKRPPAFLSAAIWTIGSAAVTTIVNHNPLSSYLAILAVYCLVRALRTTSRVWYAGAGFLLGAVALFLQTKGLALAAAFCVILTYHAIKRTVSPGRAALVLGAASLLPLAALTLWPPRLLWQVLIEWPAANYLTINRVSWLPLVVTGILFGIVGVALSRSTPRRPTQQRADILGVLVCVQPCLFMSIFSRPDVQHIYWNSFGVIIFVVVLLYESLPRVSAWVTVHPRIVFYRAPAAFLLLISLTVGILALAVERDFRRATAHMHAQEIYAHPFLPGLYFELGARNPYPHDSLFERAHSAEAFEKNLDVLRREHPKYLLTNYQTVEKFGYRRQNRLDDYLASAYAERSSVGPITIWERRTEGVARK